MKIKNISRHIVTIHLQLFEKMLDSVPLSINLQDVLSDLCEINESIPSPYFRNEPSVMNPCGNGFHLLASSKFSIFKIFSLLSVEGKGLIVVMGNISNVVFGSFKSDNTVRRVEIFIQNHVYADSYVCTCGNNVLSESAI